MPAARKMELMAYSVVRLPFRPNPLLGGLHFAGGFKRGVSISAGNWRAAGRTSSLPVTTSATSRVRYSRSEARFHPRQAPLAVS